MGAESSLEVIAKNSRVRDDSDSSNGTGMGIWKTTAVVGLSLAILSVASVIPQLIKKHVHQNYNEPISLVSSAYSQEIKKTETSLNVWARIIFALEQGGGTNPHIVGPNTDTLYDTFKAELKTGELEAMTESEIKKIFLQYCKITKALNKFKGGSEHHDFKIVGSNYEINITHYTFPESFLGTGQNGKSEEAFDALKNYKVPEPSIDTTGVIKKLTFNWLNCFDFKLEYDRKGAITLDGVTGYRDITKFWPDEKYQKAADIACSKLNLPQSESENIMAGLRRIDKKQYIWLTRVVEEYLKKGSN